MPKMPEYPEKAYRGIGIAAQESANKIERTIPARLGQLDHNLDRLHKNVCELANRLNPILQNEEAVAEKIPTPQPPVNGRLADTLERQSASVQRATEHIQEIIRLLEI